MDQQQNAFQQYLNSLATGNESLQLVHNLLGTFPGQTQAPALTYTQILQQNKSKFAPGISLPTLESKDSSLSSFGNLLTNLEDLKLQRETSKYPLQYPEGKAPSSPEAGKTYEQLVGQLTQLNAPQVTAAAAAARPTFSTASTPRFTASSLSAEPVEETAPSQEIKQEYQESIERLKELQTPAAPTPAPVETPKQPSSDFQELLNQVSSTTSAAAPTEVAAAPTETIPKPTEQQEAPTAPATQPPSPGTTAPDTPASGASPAQPAIPSEYSSRSEFEPKAFDMEEFQTLLGKLEGSKMRQQRQKSVEGRQSIYAKGLAQMMGNF